MENGQQVAFMAPTEILAEQHSPTIQRLLAAYALPGRAADRRVPAPPQGAARGRSAPAHIDLVVGTHALVQERRASSKRLGLAVVDEQHRFGVLQRATLRAKGCGPTCW